MTSHACSRHEVKEMYSRLINIGEVRGNMREEEGKRDKENDCMGQW
jgi:hypothetical protein